VDSFTAGEFTFAWKRQHPISFYRNSPRII